MSNVERHYWSRTRWRHGNSNSTNRPKETGELELWLQHATGRILFEDVRGYAIDRIEQALSAEAHAAAKKGIDDALYGLMMVLDGVTGALANETQRVEARRSS